MDVFQPRRIRIVEKNMQTYTGPIGGVSFVNGVSTVRVDYPTAQRIGACLGIVDADSNSTDLITPAAASLRDRNITLDNKDVQAFNNGTAFSPERFESIVFHTPEELDAIASKGGLPAILALAQKWGRKGRSIPACIAAIIQEQDKARAAKERHDKLTSETPVEQAADAQEEIVQHETETVDAPETAEEDEGKEEAEEHKDAE